MLFLEDVRNMQARSRQEKLAAMGRVSAGIAHEIRNPLAAIAQANALLAEDATDRGAAPADAHGGRQRRAAEAHRRRRDGGGARRSAQDVRAIDATAQVAAVCSEWARTAGVKLGEHSVLRVELPAAAAGRGLRRRAPAPRAGQPARQRAAATPASGPARCCCAWTSRDETRAFLSVASDGAPIPPDVERYLFEPFFSTRSRGTGLGLYICRELCERYGAQHRLPAARAAGDPHRNEFFVVMRRHAAGRAPKPDCT